MLEITDISNCWAAVSELNAHGDERKAVEVCLQNLCAEVPECQLFLGWYYYKQKDSEKAYMWFSKASEKGIADAFYGLASVRYSEGNYPDALRNFLSASQGGCHRAYHWLGYMYQKGLGVPVDYVQAAHFYRKGKAAGYLIARHALVRLAMQERGFLRRVSIFPEYFLVAFRAFILFSSANKRDDPRLADFLLLGPSINHPVESKGPGSEVSPRIMA